jgi:hypothetical protein
VIQNSALRSNSTSPTMSTISKASSDPGRKSHDLEGRSHSTKSTRTASSPDYDDQELITGISPESEPHKVIKPSTINLSYSIWSVSNCKHSITLLGSHPSLMTSPQIGERRGRKNQGKSTGRLGLKGEGRITCSLFIFYFLFFMFFIIILLLFLKVSDL